VRGESIFEKVEERRPVTIELPISYLHHSTPIKLTTELKMITEEMEFGRLMGRIPWALDNALDLSPPVDLMIAIAESIAPWAESTGAEASAQMEVEIVAEVGRVNDWVIQTSYSVEMVRPMEMLGMEEAEDALPALQSMLPPVISDELKPSAQEWPDVLAVNQPLRETAPAEAPRRLLFQQLAGAARHEAREMQAALDQYEAREMQAALDQFKETLEQLVFGPPRGAPVRVKGAIRVMKGAIRVRGEEPVPKKTEARAIKATILNDDWEVKEELGFKVERGPQIHQGKLNLSLVAPVELVGQTADVMLSMEGMEVLLGSVAVESVERGKARIELEVDLEGVGIKIKDGALLLEAFRVFIEPRQSGEEESG